MNVCQFVQKLLRQTDDVSLMTASSTGVHEKGKYFTENARKIVILGACNINLSLFLLAA
jgi:HKD family nuclease